MTKCQQIKQVGLSQLINRNSWIVFYLQINIQNKVPNLLKAFRTCRKAKFHMSTKPNDAMSSPLGSVRSAKSTKSNTIKQVSLSEIEHPQKVRVLILTEQKLIFQQYYYLKNFTQIIKLDLSYNKIAQFPAGFSFKHFLNLQTLFLHYNKFDKLKNLQLLAYSNQIVYLTLFGNPIEQTRARHFCLNIIPSLKLMDDKPVKQEEKYSGIFNFQFSSQNDRVGFPLIEISQKESSIEFLGSVMRQIKMAKQFYLKLNPIILIQRWWKKELSKKNKYKQFIQQTKIQNFNQVKSLIHQVNTPSQSERIQSMESSNLTIKQNVIVESTKVQLHDEEGNEDTINQKIRGCRLKILRAFQTLFEGLNSFKYLLNQDTSLFCPKQYCLLHGYNFKQNSKFHNKYLQAYSIPFTNQKYSLKKQKSKLFLSLIFYNNFHHLVQLKSKKTISHTQLKNISPPNPKSSKQLISSELVEIDLSTPQKLKLIQSQYFKSKIHTHSKPFPFLFGINLVKISAAIKIQKKWRGFKVRKNFNALEKVRREFAAKKIQKWLRHLKFKHRQNFLIESFLFLKNNQSPNIVMKLETFSCLHKIYQKVLEKDPLMKLPFQESDFEIVQNINEKSMADQIEDGEQLSLGSKKIKTEITFSAARQPFPSYFFKFIEPYQLNKSQSHEEDIDIKKFKIIELLIKGAIQVRKFQGLVDAKSKQKCNYVKFEYLNRQDANQRKFLLCLLTYSFRKKRWVTFHSEKETQAKANSTDINEQIRSTHFIKIIYDNDKKDKLFQKIEKYTKEIKKTSEVYWMPVKIRYFEGTVDYSAIIIAGVYRKNLLSTECSGFENGEDAHELAASRRRLKELNSLKTLQNKIALNNLDTKMLTPMNAKNDISRNLVSFSINLDSQSERQQSINSYDRQRENLFHSLHNDNSQFSLLQDSLLHHSTNSYGSTLPMKNNNLDESIHEKDNSIAEILNSDKKIFIQKIKNSHKHNIELITEVRKRKTEIIRRQYKTNAEQNKKLIRESSNSSLMENITKAQIIKHYQKNRSATKHQIHNFQNKFLRKGNFSIQHEMRQLKKSRSRSNNQKHDQEKNDKSNERIPFLKKSGRYDERGNDKEGQNKNGENKIGQARQYIKMKKQILKTELKQFSIQLSEGFQVASSMYPESEMHLQHSDTINLLLQEHKRSKELKTHNRRQALSSATSQKYTKLYEQKRREFLRSQEKQEANYSSCDPIMDQPQVVVNQKDSEMQKRESKEKMRLESEKKKMLKKKKIVHSVFPQEFYPLQDSQQIGFHLPKIKSNISKH